QNERVITSTKPCGLIGSGEQCVDFRTSEKLHQSACKPLTRNSKYTLDLCGMRRRLECRETKEGAQSCQAKIPTAGTDALMLLKMVKKCRDQGSINCLKAQPGRRLLQSLFGKLQELAESVAVGTDRVRTCLTLLHQALRKEMLQQYCQADWVVHSAD